MVCNARASQPASPMLAISPPSLLRCWLGSLANRVGSATLRCWSVQTSRYHYHHAPPSTATSPLDSIPRDKYHTTRVSPTQQFLRPRGQTTIAIMSQFVGQVYTTTHHPLQTTLSNPIVPFRPVSRIHAHGTMLTPAPTHALSAAWPPPSP